MARYFLGTVMAAVFFVSRLSGQSDMPSTIWFFERVDSIGGLPLRGLTDRPMVIETALGKVAQFDGVNDGLILDSNPLGTATEFTIEVILRPDSDAIESQPRFFHVRPIASDQRRVTMEIRLLPNKRWILDTFIRSELSNLTLLDSSWTHTSNAWHHVALVYENATMRQYVDGTFQTSGAVTYLPIDTAGRTSIGVRQDPRYWFKGAIRMVKITRRVLPPSQFTLPGSAETNESRALPKEFQLHQNDPNPFNPATVIQYAVAALSSEPRAPSPEYSRGFERQKFNSMAQLSVDDIIGREAAVLANEIRPAGTHSVAGDATTCATGVYVYRLQSGNCVLTHKLVALR